MNSKPSNDTWSHGSKFVRASPKFHFSIFIAHATFEENRLELMSHCCFFADFDQNFVKLGAMPPDPQALTHFTSIVSCHPIVKGVRTTTATYS